MGNWQGISELYKQLLAFTFQIYLYFKKYPELSGKLEQAHNKSNIYIIMTSCF